MPAATAPKPRNSARAMAARAATATTRRPSPIRRLTRSSIAVPPYLHLDLTLQALAAGKHVLVEKPAFPTMDGYRAALEARNRARRVVLIGENDHYKPLAVRLRHAAGRRRDRRTGVRALRHHRTTTQDRRRLAQRREAGRRRRVLRGGHSLAAPGRQPRAAHRQRAWLSAGAVARGPGHDASRA